MSLGGYMGMKYGFGQRTTNEFKLGYEIMKIAWYYCNLEMSYDLKAQA